MLRANLSTILRSYGTTESSGAIGLVARMNTAATTNNKRPLSVEFVRGPLTFIRRRKNYLLLVCGTASSSSFSHVSAPFLLAA